MKNIVKKCSVLLAAMLVMSSCIKETEPTSMTTPGQIASNSSSLEATITGICSGIHKCYFGYNAYQGSAFPFDFGYEAMALIRDLYCQDMPVVNTDGWDWFADWSRVDAMGPGFLSGQLIWNFYWAAIKPANDAISVIDPASATPVQLQYLGIAKCFRAMLYLDMARMYEFKQNKYTSAPEVEGLTVQIVTPGMTEAEARNNPRATKAKMAEFIMGDLTEAITYLEGYKPKAKNFPTQAVAYGLQARLYLWLEDYPKAKTAAQAALAAGSFTPLTSAEWHDTATGFNSSSTNYSWMWADMISSTDPTVTKDATTCWMSHGSNETTFGYAWYANGLRAADRSFYERIKDTDFRKWTFLAPKDSDLRSKTKFCPATDTKWVAALPDYSSTKFRPGQGNIDSPTVGGAVDFPLMRCEEMHFVIAECDARTGSAASLVSFMTSYRDPSYTCTKSGQDLIDEVIFQKRVELWGEGLAYFDFKRLNMSVTRGYTGTNYSKNWNAYNTDGLPAWMNQCAVNNENKQNPAFINNPDPTGKVPFWE